VDSKKSADLSL